MSHTRTRELERRAQAEGNAESAANFIQARLRERSDDLELSRILRTFVPDIRRAALELIVDLPEDRQIILRAMAMLDAQIDPAVDSVFQSFNSRQGDVPLHERNTIFQSIHRTLTPEQARLILDNKEIHEPKLVLVPVTSVDRYAEALQTASKNMEGSQGPYFSEFSRNQLNTQALLQVADDTIKKWRFAITEGARTFDIPEWDNGTETRAQRIQRFNQRFSNNEMTRLDLQTYIALMVQGLLQGKPIDCKYEDDSTKRNANVISRQYTLLNEEENGLVGAADWLHDFRFVSLDAGFSLFRDSVARFRLAVMGDLI